MLLAHEGASGLVDTLEGIVGAMSRFTLAPFPVTSGELMLAAGMARSCPTPAEGRAVLDEVRTEAVADVPRDLLWPSAIWALAESTQAVGHPGMAGAVYDVARPFRWLTVVNPGGVYLGSMEHHLGVLAATSGAADVAAGHFDAAVEAHRAAGADEWVARSRVQRGAIKPRGRGAPSA